MELRDIEIFLTLGTELLARAKLAARGRTGVLRMGTIAVDLPELRACFDAFAAARPAGGPAGRRWGIRAGRGVSSSW